MIKRTFTFLFSIAFILCYSHKATAQSAGGNLSIGENGIVYVHGTHHFSEGSGFIASGMIHTNKVGAKGYLAFSEGSTWQGATVEQFVDGYVQVLHKQPFIFPIGEGHNYRPVAISGGVGTTAAYFKGTPTSITKAVKNKSFDRISTEEYWAVEGQQLTNLSFFWGKESKAAYLTDGQLEKLTIMGYKNGKWQMIASKVQNEIPHSLAEYTETKKKTSSFQDGVITTRNPIIPSDYDYFTLGAASPTTIEVKMDLVKLYPNPVVEDVYVDIAAAGITSGKITIYSTNGNQLVERTFDSTAKTIQHFNVSSYSNGLYELRIKSGDKEVSKKFIVGNL